MGPTLYTSDFHKHGTFKGSWPIQPLLDVYQRGMNRNRGASSKTFVDWCEVKLLCIHTSKTKEMVTSFQRKECQILGVNIQEFDIDTVGMYEHLRAHINNKLDWSDNTDVLHRKGPGELEALRGTGSNSISWWAEQAQSWTALWTLRRRMLSKLKSILDNIPSRPAWDWRVLHNRLSQHIHCVGSSITSAPSYCSNIPSFSTIYYINIHLRIKIIFCTAIYIPFWVHYIIHMLW